MTSIRVHTLPKDCLLARYQSLDQTNTDHNYTDCYSTTIRGKCSLEDFVFSFYTTWLFRSERFVLSQAFGRLSTDEDVRRIAAGTSDTFAAWTLEDRTSSELLLSDVRGATRSWFMVNGSKDGLPSETRLFFGSAIVAEQVNEGSPTIRRPYRWLIPFHQLYSRGLLWTAVRNL